MNVRFFSCTRLAGLFLTLVALFVTVGAQSSDLDAIRIGKHPDKTRFVVAVLDWAVSETCFFLPEYTPAASCVFPVERRDVALKCADFSNPICPPDAIRWLCWWLFGLALKRALFFKEAVPTEAKFCSAPDNAATLKS